jgi:hypothetical protein
VKSAATRTKVDSDLDTRIAAFQGDEERVDVLQRARRFKASWIELGEALSRVMSSERFKEWGYASFEDYCSKELHIRRETAFKLTGSYTFLKSRAPDVLRRDGMRAPIPPMESVSFWRRAEEESEAEAPAEALKELRRAVVDEGAPAASLKRRYKEVFFPTGDEEKKDRDRSAVLSAAQKLLELLADARSVPKTLAADVEEQLGRLIQTLTT